MHTCESFSCDPKRDTDVGRIEAFMKKMCNRKIRYVSSLRSEIYIELFLHTISCDALHIFSMEALRKQKKTFLECLFRLRQLDTTWGDSSAPSLLGCNILLLTDRKPVLWILDARNFDDRFFGMDASEVWQPGYSVSWSTQTYGFLDIKFGDHPIQLICYYLLKHRSFFGGIGRVKIDLNYPVREVSTVTCLDDDDMLTGFYFGLG
ncbi:hypothetical protein RCL_jg10681.t1 [Rhizophagus clarus]|uniref:Uncharacterized protein n=1 Tax=Rhizophagus clarus TaxID=94130 RepID=A0A8H3L966_9GLOM|nr:hypothetical protein RCL_jg10681.t1 [Rhizophagus clarus]